MKDFSQIFLAWKKAQGNRRYIVGILQQDVNGKYIFQYIKEQAEQAKKDGFSPYTEFQDLDKIYSTNVLEIFAQRLTKPERPDIKNFYSFWEIEPEHEDDKFYLLGHTQGLLATDNFEFLADYEPVKGLHFLTDLAGMSIQQLPPDTLQVDDILHTVLEKNNEFDPEAVAVYKGDTKIGYIKKIHCRVFHKEGGNKLQVKVKALDKNGRIKKVFVKVSN